MKKIIIIAVVAVVVLLFGLFAIAKMAIKKTTGKSSMGRVVRLESPKLGSLTESVSAPGEIEPVVKVAISARVSARIVELPYQEGDCVTKGDPSANPPIPASVLVRLDSADLDAELRRTEARRDAQAAQVEAEKCQIECQKADLEAAQISLDKAKIDLDRMIRLTESKDVSQSELDVAQSHYDELAARLNSSKHRLKAAELGLSIQEHNLEATEAEVARAREAISYATIISPIDGVITRCNAKVGELAMTGTMNNPGTMILEVADLSQMVAVVRLDEVDIGQIKPGQTASVTIHAYPDEKFEGTVESVALTRDADKRGTTFYKTRILLVNGSHPLQSGLNADADIRTQTHEGVLTLPSQAIMGRKTEELPFKVRDGNAIVDMNKSTTPVVYCFIDNKSAMRPVKIGASDKTHTVIMEGIAEQDRVVVGPYKALNDMRDELPLRDEAAVEKEKSARKKGGNIADTDSKEIQKAI